MTGLMLVSKPERDFKFGVGDVCVLNSGSPVMTVTVIEPNGNRCVDWDGGSTSFPSICLRPHALMWLLTERSNGKR